jgi:hypothetical protein
MTAAEVDDGGSRHQQRQTTTRATADDDNGNGRQQQQQTMTLADNDGTQEWVTDYKGEGGEQVVNNNSIRARWAESMKK